MGPEGITEPIRVLDAFACRAPCSLSVGGVPGAWRGDRCAEMRPLGPAVVRGLLWRQLAAGLRWVLGVWLLYLRGGRWFANAAAAGLRWVLCV
eukprot:scaffold8624_cov110-Isochrysis_galbana.AAC.4